jgi:hypothetical protein
VSKQISANQISLVFNSEINQLECPTGGDDVYISTSTDIYSFKADGSGLHKIVSSPEGLDQFAASTQQLIYLSNDKFHICNKESKAVKTIPVEGELVLNALNFAFFGSEEKIVFVGESSKPGPGGTEIPVYRICLLDLKTETASLLSTGFYSTIPKLLSWRGENVLILNEDSGDCFLLSTKTRSEQPLTLNYSSIYTDGVVESVAVSQDGKRVAFSVAYPTDRVQIFIKEDWKSRMIFELEGEGGLRRALLWSPNSQWISYINSWFSSSTLYLIPVTSEKPEALEASSLGLDSKLAWLPKGDGLAYSDGKEMHILKSTDLISK